MKKEFLCVILLFVIVLSVKSQKVYMTGDSHVTSKIYPNTVEGVLEKVYPDIDFKFWGKVGAKFSSFNETPSYMDSIYNAEPDILIVHLGTNDSYGDFQNEKFEKELSIFFNDVRKNLPKCKIVFVTPFYNKLKSRKQVKGKKKRQTIYILNEGTRKCSQVILDFAKDKRDVFVIDNNSDAGKIFLSSPQLIRPDNVHLTVEGYQILGEQIGAKLLDLKGLWN